MDDYLDNSGRDDVLSGGARKIPVDTPAGRFAVWVKRVGNRPDLRVLLLHGGPGATHEYFEACDSYLPAAGIEYYYYDQLGSGFSDQPDEPSLWDLDRFVDEVEQVHAGTKRAGHQPRRQPGALGADRRAGLDPGADPGHRRAARHDGPRAHADDGGPTAPRPVPALPGRQPHGYVRRPAGVLHRADRLPARPGRGERRLTKRSGHSRGWLSDQMRVAVRWLMRQACDVR